MIDIKLAEHRANQIRSQLNLGQRPIGNVFTLLEDIGIFLFKRPFENDKISAMFIRDTKNHLIIINSSRTFGHQVFSAAHELYHYYFDKHYMGGICSANRNQKTEHEQMADMFASCFLLPDDGVMSVAETRTDSNGKLDLYDLVFLQQYFRVSWNALLIKLENLGYIDNKKDYLNIGITKLTRKLDYDTTLVEKTYDKYISKRYLELALNCYENDEISEARTIEYLNDVDASTTLMINDWMCDAQQNGMEEIYDE